MAQRAMMGQLWSMATLFISAFSLCVGSFINVCVWRLPRDKSIIVPGSHCPRCGHVLSPWENIPVLSWLVLRGRCRDCGGRISLRYPLVELLTCVVFLLIWARVWTQQLPLSLLPGYFFLAGALIAIALIDVEHLIIPNTITFTGLTLAPVLAVVLPRSHISATTLGGPMASGDLFTDWLLHLLATLLPACLVRAWMVALADSLFGMFFGFAMLWIVLEAGKRLWGKRHCSVTDPVRLEMTSDGVVVAEHFAASWDELLFRETDRFEALGAAVTVTARGADSTAATSNGGKGDTPPARVVVSAGWVEVNGTRHSWQDISQVTCEVTHWTIPREVMGFGDVKLLAMVGAFLGAHACIFILMIAAVIGSLVGALIVVFHPQRHQALIPFGPFLSLGSLAWILRGPEFVDWYSRLLLAHLWH